MLKVACSGPGVSRTRNLFVTSPIYRPLDSDLSMGTQVTRTVAVCFAVLRQLRSIRRSIPDPVFQSLMVSLVLTKLDYGNATLTVTEAPDWAVS